MKEITNSDSKSLEEMQRQLREFLKQRFPEANSINITRMAAGGGAEEPPPKNEPASFEFDYKPRDIKKHLDRFVIKQDDAKKVLSVALCDHYHHVRQAFAGNPQANYAKQNIILVGPTGVGKTYLVRSMAELIGVPFVKADATKFSETGYVGGDVEDLVRDLVRQANGDVARAQYGIIYLDEVDKIAIANNLTGRDVSGKGVQTNLLKLMEETEVPARAPNDIAGQIQSMMDMTGRGSGKKQPATVNTRHILFIVSGAFDGLEKIVRKRMRDASIGFNAKSPANEGSDVLLRQAQTRDFIDFGFEPEFIGRLPVRVFCQPLNVDDLFQILKSSEGSLVKQYEYAFQSYGIKTEFQDDALRRIAELAVEEQTGARGLMTVCERIMRDFKFELPSSLVSHFTVTREVIEQPVESLKKLISESCREDRAVALKAIHDYTSLIEQEHGFKLQFNDEAVARLIELAAEKSVRTSDLCRTLFKDFQFGLKLIRQNTQQTEFVITPDVVNDPDKCLSDWVVTSYRGIHMQNSAASEGDAEPKKAD